MNIIITIMIIVIIIIIIIIYRCIATGGLQSAAAGVCGLSNNYL